jgi:hypothetical protein
MKASSRLCLLLLGSIVLANFGCGGSDSNTPGRSTSLTVTSALDTDQPSAGAVTLRSALATAGSGQTITFDTALNGAIFELNIIGESHTTLKGEVYSGGPPVYQGYFDRDYGKSALYARKNVVIDASNLPLGITIKWAGGDSNPARVLAVYGDLTLKNVTITGGRSTAEAITGGTQPYTLARGGGLAVWGTATLENCTISGNKITGDVESSRDRGTYGGGIYANGLKIRNCVISGNSAIGYGAAGGGIYSVGGADNVNIQNLGNEVTLANCTVSGNRVTAQHAYGAGVFTLAGGPTNRAWMKITNCTIARNLAEDNPNIPEVGQYYYRGGGIYMGGGSLSVVSSTIAENEVNGNLAIFSGKSNMGGGGIASTIGDAHVVEDLVMQHSVVAGNRMNGASADYFAGSLLNFYSYGYNRFGSMDFGQILVPVPDWTDMSRKHYPKAGDRDGVSAAQVLALDQIQYRNSIVSAGTDAGQPAVLWYPPTGTAVDQIPSSSYSVAYITAGYSGFGSSKDDFLNHVLENLRTTHGDVLGSDFGTSFGDLTGTTFYGPAQTWPSNSQNAAWIKFWRDLDVAINGRLGTAGLNDDYWGSFPTGQVGNERVTVVSNTGSVQLVTTDQRGNSRSAVQLGDIGAIEK